MMRESEAWREVAWLIDGLPTWRRPLGLMTAIREVSGEAHYYSASDRLAEHWRVTNPKTWTDFSREERVLAALLLALECEDEERGPA